MESHYSRRDKRNQQDIDSFLKLVSSLSPNNIARKLAQIASVAFLLNVLVVYVVFALI